MQSWLEKSVYLDKMGKGEGRGYRGRPGGEGDERWVSRSSRTVPMVDQR